MARFSDLPTELLILILTELRLSPTAFKTLARCLLVNKRWHDTAAPILYRNVEIRDSQFDAFFRSFNSEKYASSIRSCTCKSAHQKTFTSPTDDDVIQAVSSMCHLTTFSLKIWSWPFRLAPPFHERAITHNLLERLLAALPPSCIHLELDTASSDLWNPYDRKHLCLSIPPLLPRLHSLNIRLHHMCEHLFGTGKLSDHSYSRARMPQMKKLVVNCMLERMSIPLCDRTGTRWRTIDARHNLAEVLSRMVPEQLPNGGQKQVDVQLIAEQDVQIL